MPPSRVVVALGGNAFVAPGQPLTMAGQFAYAREALAQLGPLLAPPFQLLVAHGNGPQVGFELIRVAAALGQAYAVPLDVCVAESQGELGYVLAQSLRHVLAARGIDRPIAGLLTQVVVDPLDPAFQNPTKPIGPFYSAEQADDLRRRGDQVRQDAGRGFRRVVASPEPLEVVECETIRSLLEQNVLVIAAGGGGVPVVRDGAGLRGVEAVVDKDLTAALLADRLDARLLVILTDVSHVSRDFGRPNSAPILRTTPDELRRLAVEGHFAPGSMLPKIEAVVRFVARADRRAIITSAAELPSALEGRGGTIVEFA